MTKSFTFLSNDEFRRLCESFFVGDYSPQGIAASLAEAQEQLESKQPQLMLLDNYLPDGKGITLISNPMLLRANCSVIFITAASDMDTCSQAIRNGAFDYILKPVSWKRLSQSLERFVQFAEQQRVWKIVDQQNVEPACQRRDEAVGQQDAEEQPQRQDQLQEARQAEAHDQEQDDDGDDDDRALDDELPVRVYADVGQTVVDDGEDNHTGHHAKHGPYPAAERHAANHARRNRIQLIHKAEVVGRRADTPGFEQTTEGIKHARQRIDDQQVQRNVDPGHFCGFRVSADGENVFTEAGLVPQHPHKGHGNQRVEGDVGESETSVSVCPRREITDEISELSTVPFFIFFPH